MGMCYLSQVSCHSWPILLCNSVLFLHFPYHDKKSNFFPFQSELLFFYSLCMTFFIFITSLKHSSMVFCICSCQSCIVFLFQWKCHIPVQFVQFYTFWYRYWFIVKNRGQGEEATNFNSMRKRFLVIPWCLFLAQTMLGATLRSLILKGYKSESTVGKI